MKRFYLFFIIIFIPFLYGKKIHIIKTNDLHGVIAPQKAHFMNPNFPPEILGFAAYYDYVQSLKEELESKGEGLLILDGGNFFQGNPIGLVDGGKSVIEWMNLIGYDAITLGPNDFILGTENLLELSKIADFPILASNINLENTAPYIIKNILGVKVAIIGIISSNLRELVLDHNLNSLKLEKEIPTLSKMVETVN